MVTEIPDGQEYEISREELDFCQELENCKNALRSLRSPLSLARSEGRPTRIDDPQIVTVEWTTSMSNVVQLLEYLDQIDAKMIEGFHGCMDRAIAVLDHYEGNS